MPNNGRYGKPVYYNGEWRHVSEVTRECGISISTFNARRKQGWSVEKALETPVMSPRKFEYRGQTHTCHSAAKLPWCDVGESTLYDRIFHRGMTPKQAIETPNKRGGHSVNYIKKSRLPKECCGNCLECTLPEPCSA